MDRRRQRSKSRENYRNMTLIEVRVKCKKTSRIQLHAKYLTPGNKKPEMSAVVKRREKKYRTVDTRSICQGVKELRRLTHATQFTHSLSSTLYICHTIIPKAYTKERKNAKLLRREEKASFNSLKFPRYT